MIENLFGSSLLADEGLVDVRNDTTSGNGCLDQAVEFFISSDGELEMARCDTLHLQILRGIASQLEHLEDTRQNILTVVEFKNISWIISSEKKSQQKYFHNLSESSMKHCRVDMERTTRKRHGNEARHEEADQKQNGRVWRVAFEGSKEIQQIELAGKSNSPQRSSIRGWLHCRRQRWHRHAHGWLCGSSNDDGYVRRGTNFLMMKQKIGWREN